MAPISQLASSSSPPQSSAIPVMRRPKMNDNNIKLIEKVIKRQNLTAQQESRSIHHNQLIEPMNNTNLNAKQQNLPTNYGSYEEGVQQRQNNKSPQLIIKNSYAEGTSLSLANSKSPAMKLRGGDNDEN